MNTPDIKKILEEDYVVFLKYVRINNEFRFALASDWNAPAHSQMVNQGENVVSAGIFKVYHDKRFVWENTYSMTLKIGTKPDDQERIINCIFSESQMK